MNFSHSLCWIILKDLTVNDVMLLDRVTMEDFEKDDSVVLCIIDDGVIIEAPRYKAQWILYLFNLEQAKIALLNQSLANYFEHPQHSRLVSELH